MKCFYLFFIYFFRYERQLDRQAAAVLGQLAVETGKQRAAERTSGEITLQWTSTVLV